MRLAHFWLDLVRTTWACLRPLWLPQVPTLYTGPRNLRPSSPPLHLHPPSRPRRRLTTTAVSSRPCLAPSIQHSARTVSTYERYPSAAVSLVVRTRVQVRAPAPCQSKGPGPLALARLACRLAWPASFRLAGFRPSSYTTPYSPTGQYSILLFTSSTLPAPPLSIVIYLYFFSLAPSYRPVRPRLLPSNSPSPFHSTLYALLLCRLRLCVARGVGFQEETEKKR